MSSLVFLFGVLEGVLSFALPIINAFRKPVHIGNQLHFEIFQIVQYTLSIFALAYLQTLLAYHSRQQKRYAEEAVHRLDDAFDENTYNEPQNEHNENEDTPSNGRGNAFPRVEVVVLSNLSPKYLYIDPQGTNTGTDSISSELSRERPLMNIQTNNSADSSEADSVIRAFAVSPRGRGNLRSLGRIFGDHRKPDKRVSVPFAQHPIGSNLYLRLGAVVFGFGVMIMDGLGAADQLDETNYAFGCHSVLWIPVNIVHSGYVFLQTYFIFKYHRVIFNVQKFFVRFILCHLTVVNMGQWLSTVVQEIASMSEETVFTLNNEITLNSTDVMEGFPINTPTKSPQCSSQVSNFAHYLIPCAVEYSLIAMAIFHKMLQRTGSVQRIVNSHRQQDTFAPGDEAIQANSRQRSLDPVLGDFQKLNWTKETHCQRAHKGLFFGLLLVMATVVALALFYNHLQQHNKQGALILYQITDITLLVVGILTTAGGFFQLRGLHMRYLSEGDAFDVNLLMVGLVGMLFYDMFLLVPAAEMVSHSAEIGLFVAKAATEMFQALFQVFLILEASSRQAANSSHVFKKPGRAIITFLLILNLAMWIVNVFELKHAENHPIHRRYYSPIVWKIITRLSLPLLIFFRFHSSICLADAWSNVYHL